MQHCTTRSAHYMSSHLTVTAPCMLPCCCGRLGVEPACCVVVHRQTPVLSVYVCVWGVWGVIHSKRGECEDEKHVVIDAHDLIRCGAMRGRFLLESPWFLWRLLCHVHPVWRCVFWVLLLYAPLYTP